MNNEDKELQEQQNNLIEERQKKIILLKRFEDILIDMERLCRKIEKIPINEQNKIVIGRLKEDIYNNRDNYEQEIRSINKKLEKIAKKIYPSIN